LGRYPTSHWQPFYGILVEERPWWNDDHKSKGSTAKGNPHSKLDVLEEITDEEGDNLLRYEFVSFMQQLMCRRTYPRERQGDIGNKFSQLLTLKVLCHGQ